MKIVIGNDHAAVELKFIIKEHLEAKGHEVINVGANTPESVDYPAIGEKAGRMIVAGEADCGVLICGTGVGISIAANKVKGIRASVCSEHFSARYTRLHNDANVLCLGARVIGEGLAIELVDIFLDTEAEGGRHALRVDMIREIENGTYSL